MRDGGLLGWDAEQAPMATVTVAVTVTVDIDVSHPGGGGFDAQTRIIRNVGSTPWTKTFTFTRDTWTVDRPVDGDTRGQTFLVATGIQPVGEDPLVVPPFFRSLKASPFSWPDTPSIDAPDFYLWDTDAGTSLEVEWEINYDDPGLDDESGTTNFQDETGLDEGMVVLATFSDEVQWTVGYGFGDTSGVDVGLDLTVVPAWYSFWTGGGFVAAQSTTPVTVDCTTLLTLSNSVNTGGSVTDTLADGTTSPWTVNTWDVKIDYTVTVS